MTIIDLINAPAEKQIKVSQYPDFQSAYDAAFETKKRFSGYAPSALSSKRRWADRPGNDYYVTEDGRMFYCTRAGSLCLIHELDPVSILSNQAFARCWFDGVNLNRTAFVVANEPMNRAACADYGVWLTTSPF